MTQVRTSPPNESLVSLVIVRLRSVEECHSPGCPKKAPSLPDPPNQTQIKMADNQTRQPQRTVGGNKNNKLSMNLSKFKIQTSNFETLSGKPHHPDHLAKGPVITRENLGCKQLKYRLLTLFFTCHYFGFFLIHLPAPSSHKGTSFFQSATSRLFQV